MQCVVLAAGEGKRMRPLTAKKPKVMLPIVNKPMIEHLVLAVRDAGITDFVFVVGYHEQEVRNYFKDGSEFGIKIRYTVQKKQMGTGDALMAAEGLVDDTFLLINGDMVLKCADIKKFISLPPPCLGVFESSHPQDFGVVTVESGMITGHVEKSKNPPGNLINAGAYLFEPEIFKILSSVTLSERGEYELTDALAGYISECRLSACTLESWLDVGEPWNILDANELLSENLSDDIKGTVEDGVFVKGTLILGKGSVVRSGTYIEGTCIVGDNCSLGPHAYIRGFTAIGDDCHIGHSVELKNSVILPCTKIPHFNYVGDSVIGSGCNFGAGTKIANLRHDNKNVKAAEETPKEESLVQWSGTM